MVLTLSILLNIGIRKTYIVMSVITTSVTTKRLVMMKTAAHV